MMLTSGFGAMLRGTVRLFGFLGLVAVLGPVQMLMLALSPRNAYRVPQLFHRSFLRLTGSRVRVHGRISTAPATLFVSNHTSHLDIPFLGAVLSASFVAKAEVAGWPLMGWLAKLQNTVFIERRASRAAAHRDTLRQRLEDGTSLILFPEGTSTDGQRVLPFRSSLFSVTEAPLSNGKPITVQPVSVVCTALGGLPMTRVWRPYYGWFGDMDFAPHFWDALCLGHFTVDLIFHPPVTADAFPDRKTLADYCQRDVARGVEMGVRGRGDFVPATPKLLLAAP